MDINIWIEDSYWTVISFDLVWKGDWQTFGESNFTFIYWQAVEIGSKNGGKALQPAQSIGSVKNFGQAGYTIGGAINACAATAAFFSFINMRCAISSQKITWVSTCGCLK